MKKRTIGISRGSHGFGLSLVYSPSLTMVGHYWKKRFGIINGIVTSGSAVFTLSMYYLLEFLMDEVGVNNIRNILSKFFKHSNTFKLISRNSY